MEKKTKILLAITYLSVGILAWVTLKPQISKLQRSSSLDPAKEDPALSKERNFALIPDGKNNFRSAQIPADKLANVIKKYGIKTIVRMNGDGSDARGVSMATEKKICEQNGCNYIFVNAHDGYKYGQGYTKSIDKVMPILDKGNTLIHCAAGADRTGYMVATHLKRQGIMTDLEQLWSYTTKYNGWSSKIKNGTFYGSGYDKYADGFYPLNLLKKKRP